MSYNRKRGRERDDYGNDGGYDDRSYGSSPFKQRRFDLDAALPDGPYRERGYRNSYGGGGGGRGGRPPRQSYGGGGGNRGRGSYYPDVIPLLSVGEKYCVDLWRFGDDLTSSSSGSNPAAGGAPSTEESSRFTSLSSEDVHGLKEETRSVWTKGSSHEVLRGFRIATSECPHKLPWLATILGLLASEPFTPPPARTPAKPLVTRTDAIMLAGGEDDDDAGGENGTANGADSAMGEGAPTSPSSVNIGLEIVKDLVKAFQNHLDARRWRSVRFSLHLFGLLASLPRPIVSPASLLELLQQSFVNALETEPGLRANRGDELARIVLETLLRLDLASLSSSDPATADTLNAMKNGLDGYLATRNLDFSYLGGETGKLSQWQDPITQLFAAVFATPDGPSSLPKPFLAYPILTGQVAEGDSSSAEAVAFEALSLPAISLPPETEAETSERPALAPTSSTEEQDDFACDQVGYSGVRASLAFFNDETVPTADSPDGVLLRQLIADVVSVYEVNRKECARIIVQDLRKWLADGTFRTPAAPANNGATTDGNGEATTPESTLIYENLVMDVIFSLLLSTPSSPSKPVYYQALVGEICKLSPQTAAPALGKCIRKLYAGLGADGSGGDESMIILGPEGLRRFAEWFAVHLSNFGFHWRWPEWESDLSLPQSHPKKVFIARVLELEIRLSYFDRIKLTIPDTYLDNDAGVYPPEAPTPLYTYDSEGHSLYVAPGNEILRLMRNRATGDEIKEQLEIYTKDFVEGEIGDPVTDEEAERIAKDIVFQAMLNIGSRSFSHFLNILERYITILREFTGSAAARLDLLQTVSRFWSLNHQFLLIVFDKLLQYRIVDPVDVVAWIFTGDRSSLIGEVVPRDWSDLTTWDALRMTLDKVRSRVLGASARLQAIRKKEENRMDTERAAAAVSSTATAATAADTQAGSSNTDGNANANGDSAAQAQADVAAIEKQVKSIRREQEALLVEVVQRFKDLFSSFSAMQTDEAGAAVTTDAWQRWFAKGWFAEFCRAYASDLQKHFDAIAMIELPQDNPVYQGLQGAHLWTEFA